MCRITTAAQSPFVDYNPIDILMGIKKGEEKSVNCQKYNSVALANLMTGYNLSQLYHLPVLKLLLLLALRFRSLSRRV